jgi:putative heme-binding domain-containing protein
MPDYVHHVARHGSPSGLGHLTRFFTFQPEADSHYSSTLLVAAIRGAQERGRPLPDELRQWAMDRCTALLESKKAEDVRDGIEVAVALNQRPAVDGLAAVIDDRQRAQDLRIAALKGLATAGASRHVGSLAVRLEDSTESAELREQVAQVLAGVNTPLARAVLLAALPRAPARLATAIAAGLAGSSEGVEDLLQAVAAGKASLQLLLERPVQVKLTTSKLPNVAERVAKLTEGLPPADANLARLLRQRAVAYAQAQPDAAAGAKVFTQHCAACHQIGTSGTKLGPQLDGIGVRGLDRLLEDTLDPNRNVDPSFRATTLSLKNGQVLAGLVVREEGQVIVLADAQGKETRIGQDQVERREVTPLSPMPANWAEQISEGDFYNLMAYLLNQRAK